MGKKGRSDPGLFGGYVNYDENGNKIGRSDPGLFGGYVNYDENGNKTGRSDPGLFGGYVHYDSKGHRIGRSDPGFFGGYTHYDNKGGKKGDSTPGLFGSYSHNDKACYIATCIYGSYDCPPVWVLRRYRDNTLAQSVFGRLFIRVYYTLSPTIVKRFGGMARFRRFWRKRLDAMVQKLRLNGVEDDPYNDLQQN